MATNTFPVDVPDVSDLASGLFGLANLGRSGPVDPGPAPVRTNNWASVASSQPAPSTSNERMAGFIDTVDQEAKKLNSRRTLFAVKNELVNQMRIQEETEADMALSPLVADLSTYAGSENWAGVYARRKQIIESPLFFKSREVKRALSELDSGLKHWGTEITTDGREVDFHDVMRMVGSGDAMQQKEGLRILALRSENGLGYVDVLPLTGAAAKDPMFRSHVKTFIKDNPRIHPEDYQMYQQAQKLFYEGMKTQYRNDPLMANKMMSDDTTSKSLQELRESMLRGKNKRSVAWAPPSSSGDIMIGDDELDSLTPVIQKEVEQRGLGWVAKLGYAVSELGPGQETMETVRGRALGKRGLEKVRQETVTAPGYTPPQEGDMFEGGGVPGFGTRVVEKEKAKTKALVEGIKRNRGFVIAELSRPDMDEQVLNTYYNDLMNTTEALNEQMFNLGMEYRFTPQHLFSQGQFQAMATLMSRRDAESAIRTGGGLALPRAAGPATVQSSGLSSLGAPVQNVMD